MIVIYHVSRISLYVAHLLIYVYISDTGSVSICFEGSCGVGSFSLHLKMETDPDRGLHIFVSTVNCIQRKLSRNGDFHTFHSNGFEVHRDLKGKPSKLKLNCSSIFTHVQCNIILPSLPWYRKCPMCSKFFKPPFFNIVSNDSFA